MFSFPLNSFAQLQFVFGITPGFSQSVPPDAVTGYVFKPKLSIVPQAGANYIFNRHWGAEALFSYCTYGLEYRNRYSSSKQSPSIISFINSEVEIESTYKLPLSKRLCLKESAGIAATLLAGNNQKDVAFGILRESNFYLVLKTGVLFKAPGHYHYVYFGFDYHRGLLIEYRGHRDSIDPDVPSQSFTGRGSYLALNMHILIGRDKYSWKKPAEKEKSFVM